MSRRFQVLFLRRELIADANRLADLADRFSVKLLDAGIDDKGCPGDLPRSDVSHEKLPPLLDRSWTHAKYARLYGPGKDLNRPGGLERAHPVGGTTELHLDCLG